MRSQIVDSYLEQQVLSASPLELITLSYQAAIQAVRDARRYFAEKRIRERVQSITRAHALLAHLYQSLDFKAGDGALARELGLLYDYMMRSLLQSNAEQNDKPLEDVLGILINLAEAWNQISSAVPAPAPRENLTPSYTDPIYAEVAESRYSLSF